MIPMNSELTLARAKIGDLMMRLELAGYRIEKSWYEKRSSPLRRLAGDRLERRRWMLCIQSVWTFTRRTRT